MYIRSITLSNGVVSYAFQLRRSSLEFSALNFVLLWGYSQGYLKEGRWLTYWVFVTVYGCGYLCIYCQSRKWGTRILLLAKKEKLFAL